MKLWIFTNSYLFINLNPIAKDLVISKEFLVNTFSNTGMIPERKGRKNK